MAAIIPKIRAGNQFTYLWAIERAGVAVDLTTATDIELSYGVGKLCTDYSKIPFTVVDANKISSSHLYAVTGTYNLKLEFKIDGEQNTIDIDAFKIVPRSDDASDSTQFAVTSDMAIGFKGDKLTFADLTPSDIAELQQPANDAIASIQAVEVAISNNENNRVDAEHDRNQEEINRQEQEVARQANTGTAIQNAQTATTNANTAKDLALEVANHPDIVQNDYWYKWNTMTDVYENTNIKAKGEAGAGAVVKQVTGISETDVMSQKAVSDEIKYTDIDIVGSSGFTIVGYINPEGVIQNDAGWYRTDYLEINKYHDIKAIGDSANQYLSFIAFFDINHVFISSIKNVGASGVEYTLPKADIPVNAEFVIVSTTTALRGASYCKQPGISLKEKIEIIEVDVSSAEENSSLAISEIIQNQTLPVINLSSINQGFSGLMAANTFGITGIIVGINAALYGTASDVNVYLINNTTKATTLITTILASSQTVNAYKNYFFPSPVTVEIGYSIALETTRCRFGSISGFGGSMYNISGSWTTDAGTLFSYQLIKEVHFVSELQKDVLKNTDDITSINSELSDVTKSLFWNIPSKLYGSSTSVWGFYRDVLIYNPVLTNNSPYRMAYSDGTSINQFGYDVISGISANTTKTFQLIRVNNGNTYETPAIVSSKAVDVLIKSKVSTPQNVLVISDSFIDAGFDILTNINSLATADGITINWVGTHINTDGQNCEAYAGWSEETFFGVSSPFMNAGNFDFANYLTTSGISVDKVVILLGSNMPSTPTTSVGTWIAKMINGGEGVTSSIKSALPNAPIFVCLCMPFLEDCPNLSTINYGGNRKWYQDYRMLANKKYIEYFDGTMNNTYVVPMLNFHPNYGYIGKDIDNGQFNLDTFPKIRVASDIHPSATGSMCIAYNIYNILSLDGL